MSEGLSAQSCGQGVHLSDDLRLVEPVAAAGQPVPPGRASQHVYVTNLYNHVLPLIRFDVTDELTVVEEPCPCGCAMRPIIDPQGRLEELFRYPGGVTVHAHVFRSALGRHPQIIEYQVRQTVGGAHIRIVAHGNVDLPVVTSDIEVSLSAIGLATPEVTAAMAPSVDRLPSGKLKRFVPLDE